MTDRIEGRGIAVPLGGYRSRGERTPDPPDQNQYPGVGTLSRNPMRERALPFCGRELGRAGGFNDDLPGHIGVDRAEIFVLARGGEGLREGVVGVERRRLELPVLLAH